MKSIRSWLDDHANPILVKEVRQALRGRYFRATYVFTLLAATLIGIFTLMAKVNDEALGQPYFMAIYLCLAGTMLGLIPFQAFVAGGGVAGKGDRMEMLQLTDLRPRQIVMGRLLSSLAQAGVIFCALLPYLALGFLLPGVDLFVIGFVIFFTLLFSAFMCCLTLGASFLTQNRVVRVLIMAFLGMGQLGFVAAAIGGASELLDWPDQLHDDEFPWAVTAMALHGLALAAVCFVGGASRLSHPEENRTSLLRIVVIGLEVVAVIFLYLLMNYGPGSPDEEVMVVGFAYMCFMLYIPGVIFATEPERLGRRVQVTAPKSRLLGFLITPLMPGGGNGSLFNSSLILAICGFMILIPPMTPDYSFNYTGGMVITAMYFMIAINLPTAFTQRFVGKHVLLRVGSLLVPPLFFLMVLLGPTLVGFLVGDPYLEDFEHPGTMPWGMETVWDNDPEAPQVWLWVSMALLVTFGVNLPRRFRGRKAVREATAIARKRAEEARK
jgi:hypothetical protein